MKNWKQILGVFVTLTLCCGLLCFCTAGGSAEPTGISIPDIENLDVATAKTLLAGKGLIPKVEYVYNNDYEYDMVVYTEPELLSYVEPDSVVTMYVCQGPAYYELADVVGYMRNVEGIEDFIWWSDADDGQGTKGFTNTWVEEGYLHIKMYLCCKSEYELEFYGDFGTASINDTFDKTVPIKVIYDSKKVNNQGARTNFEVKIPLSDLGVQKPTNMNIKFDFLVDGERETFSAGFDLSW